MKKYKMHFWISNISNTNVSLSDLNLTVPKKSHMNLLDEKHYNYTIDQLIISANSGSLHKKRDKIVIRQIPPDLTPKETVTKSNIPIDSRTKSIIIAKEEKYQELESLISDEEIEIARINQLGKYAK
jgi:hypothetical protein